MKRMLMNATQKEEMRVALVDGQSLYNLFIENDDHQQKKANIYKGRVSRVEPSLGAAFVDYGAERHGFLPLKDIVLPASNNGEPVHIKDAVKPGQEIIIQIEKEERGNKGAAITNQISLAGCYLVLMPNSPEAGGISRRVEGQERDELRAVLAQLEIPEGMGVIVRTAGVGRSSEELQWDLNVLLKQWDAINEAYAQQAAPFLIYQESSVITRAVRDYLRPDIGEILVDNKDIYTDVKSFVEKIRPDFVEKVKFYDDVTPLFSRYQIQKQIESAFQREVTLPSGGSLVFDINEALVAIDINSAKATKGEDIEQTALCTNLEAADEIARQLRMRDLGGLVVIDFIDMGPSAHQREVENRLRNAVSNDRARIQLGRISRFGLLEMSRQRLRPSLREANQMVCPRCSGMGTIRNVSSLSLAILRLIEEECMKEAGSQVQVHVPIPVSTYLLNEKRLPITELEKRYKCFILILANAKLETPHYAITRLRPNELNLQQQERLSHEISYQIDEQVVDQQLTKIIPEKPAVATVIPDAPAPARKKHTVRKAKKVGLLRRIFIALFGGGNNKKKSNNDRRNQRSGNRNYSNNRGGNRNRRPQNRRNNNQNRSGNNQNRNNRNANSQNQNRTKQQGAEANTQNSTKAQNSETANDNTQNENQKSNSNRNSQSRNHHRRSQNRRPNQNQASQTQGNQTQKSQARESEPQKSQTQGNQNPAPAKDTDGNQ
jgi:ribonuclease E